MSEALGLVAGLDAPRPADAQARAVGKVFRRLLPFLFVLYLCSYLDRVNIGYAALSMNRSLGLTATSFGIASTAFYVTYVLFEVPSNLLLVRFGARRWIARIMVTWGVASVATVFARGPLSLYVVRALVGLAEAGFVPGMLLHISLWVPPAYRARAMSWFMMAMPATMLVGAPVSGLTLWLDGVFGLSGWRWLFLLEGIPSIAMGLATLRFLPDAPRDAAWLPPEERTALEAAVGPAGTRPAGKWGTVLTPVVGLLCIAYFCLVTSLNTYVTWSPLVMREILGSTSTPLAIGFLSAIPSALTIVAMYGMGVLSDRSGDRLRHTVALFAATALGWAIVVLAAGAFPRLAGLALVSMGAFSGMALFWSFATPLLAGPASPVVIAVVSAAGIAGSALSPFVIGVLRDLTGNFAAGLWYSVALLGLGIACLLACGPRRAWYR